MIRALLTLTATGAIVAGYVDVSAASAAAPSTPERTPVLSTSSTPLSVSVTCGPNFESPQTCVAQASGGSGTGYTFTWESGKVKAGGTSEATVECPDNYSYIYESVSVTDSNSGYATTQVQLWCSPF
jgi:hypothetical protein